MARSRLPLLRRISQIFFLLLFFALLIFTSLRSTPGATGDIHLRAPVRLFFEWDPLVAVVNALAGHALYRGLLWSLMILVPTLFLGRFFCGWICPMGTLQHFVGNMPSEAKRGKQRIESNRYKRWQTVQVCGADRRAGCRVLRFDGASAGSIPSACWSAPSDCRCCRRSTLPCARLLTPLEHSHIAAIKATGGTLHAAFCSSRCWTSASRTLRKGLVLGILFIAILAASLRVTRLWCRSICPLGALLGAVSRWSVLGLHKDAD